MFDKLRKYFFTAGKTSSKSVQRKTSAARSKYNAKIYQCKTTIFHSEVQWKISGKLTCTASKNKTRSDERKVRRKIVAELSLE